jgi:hypothetical protein
MSNSTYEGAWHEAMEELEEQLHVEGVDDENEGGDEGGKSVIYFSGELS